MKKIIYLLILLFAVNSNSFSQEEEKETKTKRLKFGLDFGAYFSSKSYSQFLDGSHNSGVAMWLTNTFTKPIIEEKLGYPIKGIEFSGNTSYDISIAAGGYAGYKLREDLSLVFKVNFSILKMNSPVIIELSNPSAFTGSFVESTVTAQEQRFDFGFGIEKEFEVESKLKPFISFGLNMNYIQLERHNYNVVGNNYSILRILRVEGPLNQQQITYKKIDGFGYGVFSEIAVKYKLKAKYTAAIGVNLMVQSNKQYIEKLGTNSNYNQINLEEAKGFKLNTIAFIRLIWN